MEHEKIQGKTESEIKKGSFQLGVSVHDPSVVEVDGTYYIFGSHMEAAQCTDLRNWKSFASGVGKSNPLFSNLFDENLYRKIIARIWVHGGNMAEVEFINGSRVTAGYKD